MRLKASIYIPAIAVFFRPFRAGFFYFGWMRFKIVIYLHESGFMIVIIYMWNAKFIKMGGENMSDNREKERLNIELTDSAREYLKEKNMQQIAILLKEVGGG